MNLGLLSNHKLKKFPWYNEQNEQNACHSYLAMGGIGNEMECFVTEKTKWFLIPYMMKAKKTPPHFLITLV